nr:hypothetical protein [Rhodococcus wratislaviensis]GLK39078.1 hypothetical protein GCM10017611_59480 [Rhodococcus wratislaviensis]
MAKFLAAGACEFEQSVGGLLRVEGFAGQVGEFAERVKILQRVVARLKVERSPCRSSLVVSAIALVVGGAVIRLTVESGSVVELVADVDKALRAVVAESSLQAARISVAALTHVARDRVWRCRVSVWPI